MRSLAFDANAGGTTDNIAGQIGIAVVGRIGELRASDGVLLGAGKFQRAETSVAVALIQGTNGVGDVVQVTVHTPALPETQELANIKNKLEK